MRGEGRPPEPSADRCPSRYLITCEALSTTRETYAFAVFERAFKDFGLPRAIRTDNRIPFACPNALYGLSRLSVWWLRLGINIERIKPGHPEQNGRHERMHLTLKTEATKPASANFLQQQPGSRRNARPSNCRAFGPAYARMLRRRRGGGSSPSTTRLVQKCYLCLWNNL